MTAMNVCPHERVEPVETRDPLDAGVGPTVVIAQICVECHEELPVAWGCEDCAWVEVRRLCDPAPLRLLGRPCRKHR